MFLKNAFYILSMMGFRHGQYDMAIGDAGQQASADEVGPSVGVSLSTGQAEAGFAGELVLPLGRVALLLLASSSPPFRVREQRFRLG